MTKKTKFIHTILLLFAVFSFTSVQADWDDWGDDDWGNDDYTGDDYNDYGHDDNGGTIDLDEVTVTGEDTSGDWDDDWDDWDDESYQDFLDGNDDYDDDDCCDGDGGNGNTGATGNPPSTSPPPEEEGEILDDYPQVIQLNIPAIHSVPVKIEGGTATIVPVGNLVVEVMTVAEISAAVVLYNAENPRYPVTATNVYVENQDNLEYNNDLDWNTDIFNDWLREYIIGMIDLNKEYLEEVRFEGCSGACYCDSSACETESSDDTISDSEDKPCKSADGKKADPLINVQVLGTKNNGIKGGLYGNGRGRFHDGTDFVTPVGTPIYSIYDGVVDFSITSHFEGEKWKDKESWSGDKNGAGNRIYITSTVDSDTFQFGYWHLSEVNINPSTGKAYKSGDKIKQGSIIGFSGSTGNANSPDSAGPHLHLRGRKNGQKYNPLNSFQSKIDPVTGKGSCQQ